jgi:hypothetical protein
LLPERCEFKPTSPESPRDLRKPATTQQDECQAS